MINGTLYRREMKKSINMLLFFMAVLTMYMVIIIGFYDPKMMKMLDSFYAMMPGLMAAVGMKAGSTTLLGFMVSYLYGAILIIFPMIYSILRANDLIAKYVDSGSMAVLLAAPVKRRTIVITQLSALLSGVCLLMLYTTVLELIVIGYKYPQELLVADLLRLNLGLLFLHFLIAGICFLSSCIFSQSNYSLAFGAGIPTLMYIFQMLANVGKKAKMFKYFTFFTLFDPDSIVAKEAGAFIGPIILFIGAIALYLLGGIIYCKKDMSL